MAIQIKIAPFVYAKIMAYADECDKEISGFASFSLKHKKIGSIMPLLEQECTTAESEISDKMIEALALSSWSAKANVWWHSHCHMSVFWSQQDESTIEMFGKTRHPWMISIVVNKKGEYKARVDIYTPIRATHEVTLLFDYDVSNKERDFIKEEIEAKVSAPHIAAGRVVTPTGSSFRNERWVKDDKTGRYVPPWLKDSGYCLDNDGKVVRSDDPDQEVLQFGGF